MIACHKKHLIARCRERGYTLDEVRACIVKEDGDLITVDETHPAYPKAPKPGVELPSKPSFAQKLKNFAKSAVKHIASGMPMCTEDEVRARHDICTGCEFYKDESCLKCGCPLVREKKYISKLSWAHEECPIGKWGKIERDNGT